MPDAQERLTEPEGKTLEFKRDLSSPDKVIRKILDSTEITDYPVRAVEEAVAFVLRHPSRRVEIEGLRGHAVPEVPVAALREAVINAVVHADYAQRGSTLRVAVFADRIVVEIRAGCLRV